ncbi:MAG TPA: NrfD/PsrC family molybdoenzyme membrane anchor subunit [Mycobacteriales bacterium]|nr:NrfD/PsrC family molybdoenzyme membrane anchor subunit [Mycobacteriales bacterium]
MSGSDVTKDGIHGARPDREATVGVNAGRAGGGGGRRRRGGAERAMVPDAQFTSYYGKPIINSPVWEAPDIPGYLFLGGLAGAGSVLAAGAELTGRPALARACKVGAFGAVSAGLVGLVHDLGKPERFLNMLRTFKPTSPMSVGSWVLAGYGPAAGVAAASAVTGLLPTIGRAATAGAAVLGPAVASYTAALISDTAVPAWHDGFREMPFVFVGSAASAAAGLGMFAAPVGENAPARRLAVLGAALELTASKRMEHRMGPVAEPYHHGRSGMMMRTAEAMTIAGSIGGLLLAGRSRVAATVSGAALLAASALTRFAIFEAGMVSADNPDYTVGPQRERLARRQPAGAAAVSAPGRHRSAADVPSNNQGA